MCINLLHLAFWDYWGTVGSVGNRGTGKEELDKGRTEGGENGQFGVLSGSIKI